MNFKLWLAAPTALLFLACSTEHENAVSDTNEAQALSCSKGPAQYDNAHAPPIKAPTGDAQLPSCEARCGSTPLESPLYGRSWSYESLPSGACHAEPRCQIAASTTQTCGTDTHACNLSNVVCDCESGEWKCYLVAQGGGLCLPCAGQ